MNSWTIYGKNGVAKAEVNELELHDEWMAECFLTVSVKSAEPIDFAVDDYIDYRGERYAIQYDPTLLKKSSRNLGNRLNRWIDSLTQNEIRDYINCLYQLIGGYEKTMVYELKPTEILSRFHDLIRHGDDVEKKQFLRVSAKILTC